MAIDPDVSLTRYEVPRGRLHVFVTLVIITNPSLTHVAGLSLIAAHAAQFKEYLAKDHEVSTRVVLIPVDHSLPVSPAHVQVPE